MPVLSVFSPRNQSAPPPPAPPPVPGRDEGDGAVVVERQTQKTEPPRLYQVLLLNDDFTKVQACLSAGLRSAEHAEFASKLAAKK